MLSVEGESEFNMSALSAATLKGLQNVIFLYCLSLLYLEGQMSVQRQNERLNNLFHSETSNKDSDPDVRGERDQIRAYDMFANGTSVFQRGVYDKGDEDPVDPDTNFKLKSIRNLRKKDIMSNVSGVSRPDTSGKACHGEDSRYLLEL